jgi:glycosyltransferase involved in cell wall biosynthesis
VKNKFKIVIPLYNAEKWIKFCIRSIKNQTFENFDCIILDDISTDSSAEVVRKEIEGDNRFKLVINSEKSFSLKNIYDGIGLMSPDDEDVIVTIDGDDWLANKDVLQKLNNVYNEKECWLTYGSYAEYPRNIRGKFAKKLPQKIIDDNSFRSFEWCTSHLRTFKYHLWKKIDKVDLTDSNGDFYKMTGDLAFMFPMLEMAGNKSHYIEDILYVYNVDNPINDHKVDNSLQRKIEMILRSSKRYERLTG